MKKYELSEEDINVLTGIAAADTSMLKEFEKDSHVIMKAASIISLKIENHLNGTAPFPEEKIEYTRKTIKAGKIASDLLRMIFGGI